MQSIRSTETSIEVMLRKELWRRGFRYRKYCRDLPGKPDIVFKGHKLAIFCDSEFWHGYDWENRKEHIGTRRDYWIPKIERNMARDAEVNRQLESLGYTVLRFWGKRITSDVSGCADLIEEALNRY